MPAAMARPRARPLSGSIAKEAPEAWTDAAEPALVVGPVPGPLNPQAGSCRLHAGRRRRRRRLLPRRHRRRHCRRHCRRHLPAHHRRLPIRYNSSLRAVTAAAAAAYLRAAAASFRAATAAAFILPITRD